MLSNARNLIKFYQINRSSSLLKYKPTNNINFFGPIQYIIYISLILLNLILYLQQMAQPVLSTELVKTNWTMCRIFPYRNFGLTKFTYYYSRSFVYMPMIFPLMKSLCSLLCCFLYSFFIVQYLMLRNRK